MSGPRTIGSAFLTRGRRRQYIHHWEPSNTAPTTVETLYCEHIGDLVKCPVLRGVLISGVNLYNESISGTWQSVLNIEVSLFQECPLRGVSLRSSHGLAHRISLCRNFPLSSLESTLSLQNRISCNTPYFSQ